MALSLWMWMLMLWFLFSFQVQGINSDGSHIHHSTTRQNSTATATATATEMRRSSSRLLFEIKVHGFLLWASFGFLVPIGIILIRISQKYNSTKRITILVYFHALFQIISVILVTIGAVMSLKNFDNSFANDHQRLGLSLYFLAWLQLLLGIFRSRRGSKGRSVWYFIHWLLGIAVSVLGVINIYTGLQAYQRKMSRSPRKMIIIFTAEMIVILLMYIFQEKWDYIRKQGVILRHESVQPTDQDNSVPEKDSSFQP